MGRVFEGLGERILVNEGEQESAFGALDAVEQDADAVSDGEAAAGVFADELAGGFAIEEAFAEVGEGGEGDEALRTCIVDLESGAVYPAGPEWFFGNAVSPDGTRLGGMRVGKLVT
jgi:hypothetical protein